MSKKEARITDGFLVSFFRVKRETRVILHRNEENQHFSKKNV